MGAGIVGGEIVGAIPAAAKLAFTSSMFICGICTVCPPGKVIVCIGNIGPMPFIAIGNCPLIISYEGCAWPLKVSITLYITSMPRSLSSSKLGTKLMIPPGSVCIS